MYLWIIELEVVIRSGFVGQRGSSVDLGLGFWSLLCRNDCRSK
jgi:hypothetical protein